MKHTTAPARSQCRQWMAFAYIPFAVVLAACSPSLPVVSSAGFTAEPILRLDTGMHTAVVNRIACDSAGRWAVTASNDKTARVWEVATGNLVGVLRPPQEAGNEEGKLYAVALSPGGELAAAAGWTTRSPAERSYSVYLFDRATSRLLRRIDGFPNVVNHLAFSPDGRWIATSLGGRNGIRVSDVASGAERGRDADYGDASYSVQFSSDGRRLVSTSYDGRLREYAVDDQGALKLLKASALTGGRDPFSARFSPDGLRIAVGFTGSTVVQVLDARNLAELARPVTLGVTNGNLSKVAWSEDGRTLLAGGQWDREGQSPLRRWSVDDWSRYDDVPVARATVMDLVPIPAAAGGGWLFATGDPSWGVLDARANVLRRHDSQIADLRAQWQALRVSADAHQVRFGYLTGGQDSRVVDLSARTLERDNTATAAKLQPARIQAPGLNVGDWTDGRHPTLNGYPLLLEPHERSRSLAIAPDGRRFVLGTDWALRLFDSTGQALWTQSVPDAVWAVNISADSRFVIAAYGDGTIRWHRLDTGREVLAFFPHADRQRWVAWTPEGYFDASPGAEDLIGYHVNHGSDHEGEFVSARQLWETFYQPALIGRRLDVDGDDLVTEQVRRRGDVRRLLTAGSVPELALESPAEAQTSTGYALVVRVVNPGQGVGRLIVRIDGQEFDPRWNSPVLASSMPVSVSLPDLAAGQREVTAELVDERGVASRTVTARVRVTKVEGPPTLHLLAVGISRYRDRALASGVTFAADDARAVEAVFRNGWNGLYARMTATLLSDEQATRDGIEAAARKLAESAKPEDTVVIYLAGHATTVNGDYQYLPWETPYANRDAPIAQSLSASRLRSMMATISAGKMLVLLDTCSAGSLSVVDTASIDRLGRVSGRALIGATGDEKLALEGEGKHGVFTFALLSALRGAADADHDGFVSVLEAANYIAGQVPAITKRKWGYEQRPSVQTRGPVFLLVRRGN